LRPKILHFETHFRVKSRASEDCPKHMRVKFSRPLPIVETSEYEDPDQRRQPVSAQVQ
jgi:hypothetical protein